MGRRGPGEERGFSSHPIHGVEDEQRERTRRRKRKKKEGVAEVEDCEKPTAASPERAAAAVGSSLAVVAVVVVAANEISGVGFGGGRRRRAAKSTKIRRGLSVERGGKEEGGEISTAWFLLVGIDG